MHTNLHTQTHMNIHICVCAYVYVSATYLIQIHTIILSKNHRHKVKMLQILVPYSILNDLNKYEKKSYLHSIFAKAFSILVSGVLVINNKHFTFCVWHYRFVK